MLKPPRSLVSKHYKGLLDRVSHLTGRTDIQCTNQIEHIYPLAK